MKINGKEVANPGSNEALGQGCSCPVLDNGRGRGAWGGRIPPGKDEPDFWLDDGCPLHAPAAKEMLHGG